MSAQLLAGSKDMYGAIHRNGDSWDRISLCSRHASSFLLVFLFCFCFAQVEFEMLTGHPRGYVKENL